MPRADAQNNSPGSDLTAPQVGKSTFAQVATQLNQISSDCSQVNDKMYNPLTKISCVMRKQEFEGSRPHKYSGLWEDVGSCG